MQVSSNVRVVPLICQRTSVTQEYNIILYDYGVLAQCCEHAGGLVWKLAKSSVRKNPGRKWVTFTMALDRYSPVQYTAPIIGSLRRIHTRSQLDGV